MNIFQRLRQHFASAKGTIEERPTSEGVECGDVGLMSPVEGAIAQIKRHLPQEVVAAKDTDALLADFVGADQDAATAAFMELRLRIQQRMDELSASFDGGGHRPNVQYIHIEEPVRRVAVERVRHQFPIEVDQPSGMDGGPSADEILEGAELLQSFGMDCFEAAEAIERMQMEGEVQDEMNRMRSQHERHRRMFRNALSFEPQPVRSQRPKIKTIPKLCQGCQWLSEELRGDFVASAERLHCAVQPTGPDSEGHCSEFDALPPAEHPTTDWMAIFDDCEGAYDER